MAAVPVLGRLAGGGRAILIAFDASGGQTISRLAFLPHPTLCVPVRGDLAGPGERIFVNVEADGSSSMTRDVPGTGSPVPVFGTVAGDGLAITLSAGLTGAVTAALASGSGVPKIRAIATNGAFPNNFATGAKQLQSDRRHVIRSRVSAIKARLVNAYIDPTTWVEKAPGDAATITMGLIVNGTNVGSFKLNGATSMVIADGAFADTDWLAVELYPGDIVFTRTFYTNTAGILYEGEVTSGTRPGYQDLVNGEKAVYAASGLTDQTTGAGTLTGSNQTPAMGGPFALMGMTTDKSIMILGDSEEVGIGEAFTGTGGARGVYARSLASKAAFSKVARGGDGAVKFVASHALRIQMADIFDKVYCNFGVNDITNYSRTPAQVIADLQTIAGYFPGLPFFGRTLTPVSKSSSDNWTTTSGQTPSTKAADLNAFNALLRAVPTGIAGVFETSDLLSTARDSNIWLADNVTLRLNTADGLHPTANASEIIRVSGVIS